MNLLWTQLCQLPLPSHSLSVPTFQHGLSISFHSVPILFLDFFIFHHAMLSGCIFSFLLMLHMLLHPPPLPPPPIHFYSLSEPNPQIHQHTQILLTDIWRVSGITRTVLIRTSWHILAKTCTYGNSIRKKGEGGREKKWTGAHRG